uniref:Secreted protein n=1 Tax=Heterorhabditis bacteriophora TaxID=37862 RepID=A0A1I7WJJ2_HETBA
MRILLSPVLLGLFLVVDAQSSIPVPTSTTTNSTKTLVHENDPFSDEVSKEPFELTGSLETGMHLSDKLSILGTEAIMVSQLVEKSTIEPRINSEPEVKSESKAEPIAKNELEAKSKINPKSEASKSDSDQKLESKPEPEPAIKFDNIQSEDYGDIWFKKFEIFFFFVSFKMIAYLSNLSCQIDSMSFESFKIIAHLIKICVYDKNNNKKYAQSNLIHGVDSCFNGSIGLDGNTIL